VESVLNFFAGFRLHVEVVHSEHKIVLRVYTVFLHNYAYGNIWAFPFQLIRWVVLTCLLCQQYYYFPLCLCTMTVCREEKRRSSLN